MAVSDGNLMTTFSFHCFGGSIISSAPYVIYLYISIYIYIHQMAIWKMFTISFDFENQKMLCHVMLSGIIRVHVYQVRLAMILYMVTMLYQNTTMKN